LEYFEQALQIFIQVGAIDYVAAQRFNIAHILASLGEWDEAIQQGEQALALMRQYNLERLAGQLTRQDVERYLEQLNRQRDGGSTPAPSGPSTLPAETVNVLAGNTVAVKTGVPEKLDEWRTQVQHVRADFAGRGADWVIEVAFADALLAVLDDQPAALPDDNLYAGVVRQVVEAIEAFRRGDNL